MLYLTVSTENDTKPRTKQTARMSTGGKLPRRQRPVTDEGFHLMYIGESKDL